MAKTSATVAEETDPTAPEEYDPLAPDVMPEGWEFTVIAEESPTGVVFDKIGDKFLGMKDGIEKITPENGKDEPFELFIFRGRNGVRYAINKSYKLERALTDVPDGQWVLIEYVANIDTGRPEPMKDYRVSIVRSKP